VYLLGVKVLYLFPTTMSEKAGSSAWISAAIAAGLGLLGLWGWVLWIGATGGKGFVASLRETVGRILGDVTALFLAAMLTALTSLDIRMFVGGAVIGIVPEFPIDALLYIAILSAAYGAWLGLEAVGRAATFFLAPTLLSLAVVIYGVSRTFHLSELMPLWGLGFRPTVLQGLANAGLFGAVPAVAIVKSYLRKPEEIPSRAAAGVLAAAAILIAALVVLAGVFPYPMSTRTVEPLGVMARAVTLGRFVQRLEALFTFTWFFGAAVQGSFAFMLLLILLSQLSNTGTYRPFMPGLAFLVFGIAGIPSDTLRAAEVLDAVFTTTTGSVALGIGWVLYAVAIARGIGRDSGRPRQGIAAAPKGSEPVSAQKARRA